MNILFFDTETTGLPKNWRAPVSDLNNWPRLVQIAWIQYNTETGKENAFEYIIRPEGLEIPKGASDVHGITTERAKAEGVSLRAVLDVFARRMEAAELMVAHNIAFDRKIMGAELLRNGFDDVLHGKPRACTMLTTIKFCNIPGRYGRPKWPKLQELHQKLFGEMFADAHDALADIVATKRCFVELVNRGVIELPASEMPTTNKEG